MRCLALLLLSACTARQPGAASFPAIVGKVTEGRELIGTAAPPLEGVRWMDGKPHPLAGERGRVVLVRWWTDGCALCTNSAPAVAELARKYGDRLAVRAIFHNKQCRQELTDVQILGIADRLGFPPLVGRDPGWDVLRRWWTRDRQRRFTSVTFLLGKRGRIRLIHTGGEFHSRAQSPTCKYEGTKCESEFEAIDSAIAALVEEEA